MTREQSNRIVQTFRTHFDSWIIERVDRLIRSDDAIVGFILMSCAIDYLAGFWWGKPTKGRVQECYTGFITTHFPSGLYDPDGLYDSLRNGLVHMFTIKDRKYALVHMHPELHLKSDQSGQIILDAGCFLNDLVTAKNRYFDELIRDPKMMEKFFERFDRDGFLDAGLLSVIESGAPT